MEHILVGIAEFYSKNLGREIKKGLSERIEQGFLVFRPPYGYRREAVERREGQKTVRTISRPVIETLLRAWFNAFSNYATVVSVIKNHQDPQR